MIRLIFVLFCFLQWHKRREHKVSDNVCETMGAFHLLDENSERFSRRYQYTSLNRDYYINTASYYAKARKYERISSLLATIQEVSHILSHCLL